MKLFIITPCTCERKKGDHLDYKVIFEEDEIYFGGGLSKKSIYSKFVCMRDGCHGAFKGKWKWIKRLPRILNTEYIEIKNLGG
jgi:hypothetical protein